VAVAIAGGGAALGWPWLVAVGAAPIILSVLPCAVMCALGLCMMGKHGQNTQTTTTDVADTTSAPVRLSADAEPQAPRQITPEREPATFS
jgi:hypothetical protein